MKKVGISIMVILALALVAGAVANAHFSGPVDEKDTTAITVTIQSGSGTGAIATQLKEQDLIKEEKFFRLKSKIKGYDGKYLAGTYQFQRADSMNKIMEDLVQGNTAGQTFQVIEGQTIDKVADQLDAEGIVTKDAFYDQVEHGEFDYPFMDYLPSGPTRLEGFLFPNTYTIPLDATAYEVIDVMLAGFEEHVMSQYPEQAQEEAFYQTIIMASIIEREASKNEEKPLVGSVIENRLAIDMPLQMDSIISYIHKEDKIRATYADIQVESTYNPYKNKGLPPGPICSPGLKAIEAALSPEKTDYLYFVASPQLDGTNVYSENYEDFLKDKAAFDRAYEKYIEEHPDQE